MFLPHRWRDGIAENMTLSVNTVRTIIAKAAWKDRTTKKHRQRVERIELDRIPTDKPAAAEANR